MGSTVHILTFARHHDLSNDQVNNLTTMAGKDILGIWKGECLDDPELTMFVIAGFPDGLDPQSLLGVTPMRQERTEMSCTELIACLNAPVTEVATTNLKKECDRAQAVSLNDAAMQTVLDADGCITAAWKTSRDEAIFFVGWNDLEAHKKYHQKIFANLPDCIKEVSRIVDTSRVLHFSFGTNLLPTKGCGFY